MYKQKLTYEQVEILYNYYLSPRTSNRNSFIKNGLELGYNLTEDELFILWQAFDMAYEQVKNKYYIG